MDIADEVATEDDYVVDLIRETASKLYGIFDHDETSHSWCLVCGEQAPPRKGNCYVFRDVKHTEDCIVGQMQAWIAKQQPEAESMEAEELDLWEEPETKADEQHWLSEQRTQRLAELRAKYQRKVSK